MPNNRGLRNADRAKKDEFYTQLTDIEKELRHYTDFFKDKIVFLNCDDPEYSNFWLYFQLNFYQLGLKKLISTHYETDKPSYKMEIVANNVIRGNAQQVGIPDYVKTPLKENGDFRSPECIELLKEADVVITNPPFSLLREYVAQLIEYNKKFIIIGNINCITYKEIFPLIKEGKLWLGWSIHSGDREFQVPDDYPLEGAGIRIDAQGRRYIRVKGVRWLTNIDYKERHEDLLCYETYSPEKYPKFDYYDAINVNETRAIPNDYYEPMGVPITFIDKYNPDQFELIDGIGRYSVMDNERTKAQKNYLSMVDGKPLYFRIIIKRKKGADNNED